MEKEPLHVKVVLKIKPEFREAFEYELMSVREMCIAEKECLVFDVASQAQAQNNCAGGYDFGRARRLFEDFANGRQLEESGR